MCKKMTLLILVLGMSLTVCAYGATLTIVDLPATGTDAASGISPDKTYTHAFDFGTNAPVTINGVAFEQGTTSNLTAVYTAVSSQGYGYTIDDTRSSPANSIHAGNDASSQADGQFAELLRDMLFSSAADVDEGTIVTLSDLTPGMVYSVRWYYRSWSAGANRPITVNADGESHGIFSDTIEIQIDSGGAHYLDYTFTADDTDVTMTFITNVDNNGVHIYGLTCEVVGLPTHASNPNPKDDAVDVLRDAPLTWTPSDYAATHNVYVGTSYDEVDAATVPTASGLDVTSYDPGRMEFGETYFWRVDEVNGTPDKTVFKGSVWSFTVEPYSIQIAVDVNHVTASSSSEVNPASLIVDGSGLEGSTHGTDSATMWLSAATDLSPWLMFEFDKVQKLDKLLIWNSNTTSEGFIGWGIKDVTIEFSVDGTDWAPLEASPQIDKAPGLATYSEPQAIDLGLAVAKYVRINILGNWGGLLPQYGVAEVQFYGLPVCVRSPEPVSDSSDVLPDAIVSWRAGREAAQHTIYVGTDQNAVTDGTAPSVTSGTNSLDLASVNLELGQTYYWRVDEVNAAEAVSVWAGPVWNFSTVAALTVDDFEAYSNDSPNRPFQTWIDGVGFTNPAPGNPGNGSGAAIGHDIWSPSSPYFDGSIMETSLVYSGSQSMPVYYEGGGSQVDLPLDGENWTRNGLQTLSIAFHGIAGNTGELYAKINNVKIAYDQDPADIANNAWILWHINLSSVSGLENVTTLSIGVDGAGAAGVLYVDDIKLYAQALESTGPAFSFVKITSDEDCGISSDNVYTHTLDFGTGSPGALINGVQFDAYNNAANGTLNFNREISSGTFNDHAGNAGHNVTGGLVDLMTDMYYNGGTVPGGTTTWTLSGLTPGQTYEARIYSRQWGAGDSRNATFVFDPDGAGPISDATGRLSQDNAASAGFANGNDAYYISYQFTAQAGEDLVITATQHINTYSWHLYGLTNQEVK
ncbi:MAG: discoidin domain-containing protein [Phycisphaerae bacterium]|nr:discoidin domain-containing protein [Phycisphaerae bacterium]